MKRALLLVSAVVLLVIGALTLPPASSIVRMAEVPVPTCAKPTATSNQQTNHQRAYNYAQCLAQRQEALASNLHPVPTVTATVTETVTVTASPSSPTPTPTASPTGYPTASNTGVPDGTVLTPVTGNVTLSTAGQTYADKLVNGCIDVTASNVTIRRVKVICNGSSAIWSGSTGLVVEDAEVSCGSDGVGRTGITPQNYTARRVNAYGCENIFWAQQDVLVVDSYLHDPVPYDSARDPHTDSLQIPSGATNIVARHNRILGGYVDQSNFGNSAITMGGNVSGIVIDDNVLAGGGYALYCEQENLGGDGSPQPQYTNNRFSTMYRSTIGGFGPGFDCADDNPTGNVYHETGQPITLN